MNPPPLFRDEALAFRRQRLQGEIILTRDFPMLLISAALLGGVALALVGFFSLGFARQETVSGHTVPALGLADVAAAGAGVVTEARVREGQAVQQGDVLLVVSGERHTAQGNTQAVVQGALAQRQASLNEELRQGQVQLKQRHQALDSRIVELGRQMAQLDADIALQAQRAGLAEESAATFERLAATQYVSPMMARDRGAEALDQRSRLGALKREKASLQAQVQPLRDEQLEAASRQAREAQGLQRELALLAQQGAEAEALRQWFVRAPRAGRVSALVVQTGQAVAPGQVLARLLPADSAMEAELWLPGRALGLVKPGATVKLRYEAFPHEKYGSFSGQVRELAATPLPADEAQRVAGAAAGTPLYRLRVALPQQAVPVQGQPVALPAGMLLTATLALEQRKLYQWAFQPLSSLTGRPL